MTDPIKTGEMIAVLRKKYHMTQTELGEKLMVSPPESE
ncbi:MAG: helix-turn-helix transcriptional regulator [Clostridia bacterium]|nr:helix-turn-helix transcriptional regulator [Clostridia bacterium]